MPALRRRNKLVIPQNLSDPAPDREVASRVLLQCLRKQLTKDRPEYTADHFGRWVDTHQRKYVNPRAGKKSG
jgi:hypothetical protein